MKETAELVPARELKQGEFFRKRTGTFAYLVISPDSARFLGLSDDKVYGVSYNGNVAAVAPDLPVARCSLVDFEANQAAEREWNATFARPEKSARETSLESMLDSYTRAYVVAQSSVIAEFSGNISRQRLELLRDVNRDRATFNLEPIHTPEDWVLDEDIDL